jgi:hypothetical protein
VAVKKTLSGSPVRLPSKPKQTTQGLSKNSKPKKGKKAYKGQGR